MRHRGVYIAGGSFLYQKFVEALVDGSVVLADGVTAKRGDRIHMASGDFVSSHFIGRVSGDSIFFTVPGTDGAKGCHRSIAYHDLNKAKEAAGLVPMNA